MLTPRGKINEWDLILFASSFLRVTREKDLQVLSLMLSTMLILVMILKLIDVPFVACDYVDERK